jgi:hypothetical protein
MTEQDAERVRKAALDGIPVIRQRLKDRLIPKASDHIVAPIEKWSDDETELLMVDVTYTKEEFIKLVTDTAGRRFLKVLPFYSAISMMIALMMGITVNFGVGSITFLIIIGVLFGLNVIRVKSRAEISYLNMPINGTKIRIRFTEMGVFIRSGVNSEAVRLVWEAITRAVERPDCVEFYTNSILLRIPKRCISDLYAFKRLVDNHITHAASTK